MENLNLEEFNPKMAEVKAIADKYRGLTIKGVDDVEGYGIVKAAQIELVHARTDINKAGKKAREGARSYLNAVLKLEDELIAEILPVEKDLKAQRNIFEALKLKSERLAILPDRKERLKAVDGVLTDDEILSMDSAQFQDALNKAHSAQLEAKEAKIEAENARVEAERTKLENQQREQKIREDEAQKAREQAKQDIELAALKAEQAKDAAVQAEKDKQAKIATDLAFKVERDKQAIIDANNAKRLQDEADVKKLEEEAEATRTELRKKTAFQEFIKSHGMTILKSSLLSLVIPWDFVNS